MSDQFDGRRELDWIRVKGRQRPVAIHELVGEAGSIDARRRTLFARYAAGKPPGWDGVHVMLGK